MRDQDFQNLLRAAESNLDVPSLDTAQLAQRVREAHRRGNRRRRTVAALAPLALMVLVWALRPTAHQAPEKIDAALVGGSDFANSDKSKDIDELIAQADFHRRVALRIHELVKRDRAAGETIDAADGVVEIREQLEVVAYRMILRADALRAAMRPADEALVIYQDIVRLFPNTHSAELARKRLTDLGVIQGAT